MAMTKEAVRRYMAPGTEWMGEREGEAAAEENTGDPVITYLVVVRRAEEAQRGRTA